MSQFHALLPVRDEADIIEECLLRALAWADVIYVFDSGSVDSTWEIVQEFALRDKRILPIAKEAVFFSETRLRAYMFHVARKKMRTLDWFVRLDADEFHHISPKDFIKNYARKYETVVYHQYYDFRLLRSEVEAWNKLEEHSRERRRPIEDRRRYYTVSDYSEPRLCRYRSTMQWPEVVSFPFNAGYVARGRLPIRHYPHRDPVQLKRRCRLRALMMSDPKNGADWLGGASHWKATDWRQFITPDDLPGLAYWARGEELPLVSRSRHLKSLPVRALQRLTHAVALPLLDRTRRKFPAEMRPLPISEEMNRELQRTLVG